MKKIQIVPLIFLLLACIGYQSCKKTDIQRKANSVSGKASASTPGTDTLTDHVIEKLKE